MGVKVAGSAIALDVLLLKRTLYNYHTMRAKKGKYLRSFFIGELWGILILLFMSLAASSIFEKRFANRIYPNVTINGIPFGGKTPQEVEDFWLKANTPFATMKFEFQFENTIATISGSQLDIGYDATLSAKQAFLVGRSGHIGSDIVSKFLKKEVNLTPFFRFKTQTFDDFLATLVKRIDIPVQNALFSYKEGRVAAFKPSKDGRRINMLETRKRFAAALLAADTTNPPAGGTLLHIALPVETIKPTVTTDQVNTFGIKELIGRGYSQFHGSIPGRIYNVALAASRLNGVLIKPGETLSFNNTVGEISAATGYQSAYIIKEGRTVLDDGGGVCQVSTTLFRAALNAGLPILTRTAHAYRVHYYEEGGFKPGIDATVFSPSVDLKIKNDTANYILIQTKTDKANMNLTFELYGTRDGRTAQILNHKVWGITPPPPDLYQDDPTLPKGTTKQVDFAAWGTKASFQYKVMRGKEILQDTTFTSDFRPWQAIYLRGTL